jgi:phage gp46-like protein
MQEYTVRIDSEGDRCWYKPGTNIRHRLDGPAVECANGSRSWWADGKRHRLDGPAIEYASGTRLWYIEGEELTEQEFLTRTQSAQEITIAEIEKLIGHRVKIIDRD